MRPDTTYQLIDHTNHALQVILGSKLNLAFTFFRH